MDAVESKGVWNTTVFIVTSDHGDMQMERSSNGSCPSSSNMKSLCRQQFYKMVPYEASASVPMVIYDGTWFCNA